MSIQLPKDLQTELISRIKQFFLTERDEEIGDLQAGFVLDFFLKEIGPTLYNAAVQDVRRHLHQVVEELDTVVFAPEPGPRRGRT